MIQMMTMIKTESFINSIGYGNYLLTEMAHMTTM